MPRKSDLGTEAKDSGGIGAGTGPGGTGGYKDAGSLSIDDYTLPKSIVTRLAKGVLPRFTNVQKDAILALSKGGTVFINYLCATANDTAKNHGRKIINPNDILEAMHMMEYDDFVPRLEAELAKFNEIAAERRAAAKKTAKPNDSLSRYGTAMRLPSCIPNNGNDTPPAPKKMRVSTMVDSGAYLEKITGLTGNSVPVRGWGDEDEAQDEEMGYDEDDEIEEVEETEFEEPNEGDSETPTEIDVVGGNDQKEDEALDNGVDSD